MNMPMVINHNPISETNLKILKERFERFEKRTGPRIGDYLILPNGCKRRFTHDWGAEIQITLWGICGSFYLSHGGGVSFSGGLDSGLSVEKMVKTEEVQMGKFWFFANNEVRAHNSIDVLMPCAVWQYTDEDYLKILIHPNDTK
jgi:hypothetical protein